MAVPTTPHVRALYRDRTRVRLEAACAIALAARSLLLEPAALSASAYRTFCADQAELDLPSSLTISVLFVGWQRAREQVTALIRDDVAVEARVVQTLYGDPSRHHRDHATTRQLAGLIAGASVGAGER
jgi:hypothetical protein